MRPTSASRSSTPALQSIATEWLLTNGLGGYAMGALPAHNARRYHGLLVAAATPPVGRVVALHSVIDELVLPDGKVLPLATQRFGEMATAHPEGWRWVTAVNVTTPDEIRWTLSHEGITLTRTLRLEQGRNRATLSYDLSHDVPENARLRIMPLVALRDIHSLNRAGDPPIKTAHAQPHSVRVFRGDPPTLALDLSAPSGAWRDRPDWWRSLAYTEDRRRGQDWHEDVFCPGVFDIPLNRTHPRAELHAELTLPKAVEVAPRQGVLRAGAQAKWRDRLERAAEQFVVYRNMDGADATSIIAGYPWFADWGRDAMICVPGLLLSRRRLADAERVLRTFAHHLRGGLIPNHFDDAGGAAHYNTVDASLWFIHAATELLARHPDTTARHELTEACRTIIHAYRSGTDFHIRMDEDDRLIAAGDAQMQLTWMDAQRDGVTFTPRHGKAIEINALWHHALHRFAAVTTHAQEAEDMQQLARRAADAMQRRFWCDATQCCYDVLTPVDGQWVGDEAIRPNQIFAVSLHPSPFSPAQQQSIIRIVREKLLTPFGVRTLDPDHPDYRGRFEGTLFERDAAYHQGTVWPWLIGPYCEAVLRADNSSPSASREVELVIAPLLSELEARDTGEHQGGCIGQVAEVYDGDAPHRPSGCPAQAWSVAELLRVMEMLEIGLTPH